MSVKHPKETAKPDVEIVLIGEGACATTDVEQVLIGEGACSNSLFVRQFIDEEEEEGHNDELVERLVKD